METIENVADCSGKDVKGKLPETMKQTVRGVSNLARKARMDYRQLTRLFTGVRKELGLFPPRQGRKLPQILPDASLRKFFDAISAGEKIQEEIMLRLLFFTGVRVAELTAIQVNQVDLDSCKIFIEEGKGKKDRYILFPESFRLILKSHLASTPENVYLFESRQKRRFSERRVRQIVDKYAEKAGIEQNMHPHLLRHQLLTWLTGQGLSDAQIQLISGHSSKKSLEVYQHIGLASVTKDYQKAMRELEI